MKELAIVKILSLFLLKKLSWFAIFYDRQFWFLKLPKKQKDVTNQLEKLLNDNRGSSPVFSLLSKAILLTFYRRLDAKGVDPNIKNHSISKLIEI